MPHGFLLFWSFSLVIPLLAERRGMLRCYRYGASHSVRTMSLANILIHLTVVPTLIVKLSGSNRNIVPAPSSFICTTISLAFAVFAPASLLAVAVAAPALGGAVF